MAAWGKGSIHSFIFYSVTTLPITNNFHSLTTEVFRDDAFRYESNSDVGDENGTRHVPRLAFMQRAVMVSIDELVSLIICPVIPLHQPLCMHHHKGGQSSSHSRGNCLF